MADNVVFPTAQELADNYEVILDWVPDRARGPNPVRPTWIVDTRNGSVIRYRSLNGGSGNQFNGTRQPGAQGTNSPTYNPTYFRAYSNAQHQHQNHNLLANLVNAQAVVLPPPQAVPVPVQGQELALAEAPVAQGQELALDNDVDVLGAMLERFLVLKPTTVLDAKIIVATEKLRSLMVERLNIDGANMH
ncbi:hypothetical protein SAMD00019534_119630 [Acytostelium subglobosum LB1]|uniref:hypothetical protein n=1 Tax=Acytostelium subglobosum LB1 TaxID=1410327 RepID=UPI0006448B31|nr:hypothetical protein SAMD00019534_119630 [Acytostelium subglobosum LB1]GAM28787.1 hypothetical protein SAMD00019534_119630 [Acytostelium subglobosum LB1]|eukprot:XP_012748342.1 hypothetical protein SAMD00019534_119630 [Acytostelium subglobosum LB1]